MSSLTTILGRDPIPVPVTQEFMIYNDEHWTACNDGCTMDWTVPDGIQMIKFELVGGGGPGGSCSAGDFSVGGCGGAYAVKYLYQGIGGTGYETAPLVYFDNTGTNGSAAAGTATIGTSGATRGKIVSVAVTNGGSGYTTAPVVYFSNTHSTMESEGQSHPIAGTGGTATATITGDAVTAITMTPDFNSTEGTNSVYTLCSASTSMCSCCQCCEHEPCRNGCNSHVTGPGLHNFCATGGRGGQHFCDGRCSCYDCWRWGQCSGGNWNEKWRRCMCYPGFFGADYGFSGTPGHFSATFSCNTEFSTGPGGPTGPFNTGGMPLRGDFCTDSSYSGGQGCNFGHSVWPGGGGYSGHDDDICCWGSFGAGGLVQVTYQ